MTRVAGGGAGGGGGATYPPSGTLNIESGGPQNAGTLDFQTDTELWQDLSSGADNVGNTLHFVCSALAAAGYLQGIFEDHSTGDITIMTLSGFGTFTSAPLIHCLGYDIENDKWWVTFGSAGGSGSITVGVLYPVTKSGNTITMGSGVTPPAIGGNNAHRHGCVNNGKIIIVYQDTTSFAFDDARVYDISGASWAAPSGTNKSPFAANPLADGDVATVDESAFASGAQNNKGYWSFVGPSSTVVAMFIEFDFVNESFNDRTDQVPVNSDGNENAMWSAAIAPGDDYIIGWYPGDQTGAERCFVYNTLTDSAIAVFGLGENASEFKKALAGDFSAGVGCRMATDDTNSMDSTLCPYINISGNGTLAGVEAIGNHVSTNDDYGADSMAFLWNIDGGGFTVNANTPSLWQQGGYKRLLQAYSTSLEIIIVQALFSGNYEAKTPAQTYYTT